MVTYLSHDITILLYVCSLYLSFPCARIMSFPIGFSLYKIVCA